MPQVVFDEGRTEVPAVVVAGVVAQLELEAALDTGLLQQFRVQLLGEERVVIALVDCRRVCTRAS